MSRFHLDIRNAFVILTDDKGRDCGSVLEAVALAKTALDALTLDGASNTLPWIEVSDEVGNLVATVRADELRN